MTSLGLRLPRWVLPVAAALALLLAPGVRAQAPGPAAASAAAPLPLLPPRRRDEATLRVFNRDIFTFRAVALGVSPVDRARRAKQRIEEKLDQPGRRRSRSSPSSSARWCRSTARPCSWWRPATSTSCSRRRSTAASKRAAAALETVIEATRESRKLDAVLRATRHRWRGSCS